MSDLSEVMTVEEVAHVLRVSKAHVHNLINGKVRGVPQLPSVCPGRRHLVRRASLQNWMQKCEMAHSSAMLPASSKIGAVGA